MLQKTNSWRIMNIILMLFLASSLAFWGCSKDSTKPEDPKSEFQTVAEIGDVYLSGGTHLISAADLFNAINGAEADKYFILDIRAQADYESGHIPGAIRMNGADVMDNLSSIPKDKKIVVVCYSGQTAAQTSAILRLLGYESYSLKFAMAGWTTDPSVNKSGVWQSVTPTGAQLETTPNKFTTKQEYPNLNTGKTSPEEIIKASADAYLNGGFKNISASAVWANLNDYTIISVQDAATYNNGHVPGAVRVPLDSLGYNEYLQYLPPPPGKVLVVCYTGQTSSHLVGYLNTLGYDAWNFTFGMNSVTSDVSVCKTNYTPPAQNYPVVTGPNPK